MKTPRLAMTMSKSKKMCDWNFKNHQLLRCGQKKKSSIKTVSSQMIKKDKKIDRILRRLACVKL